jgi:tungstate transport system ATP-binding protein
MLYELEAVTRSYGGRAVLDIPALSIQEERIYSLIGPNGAGKTTLLNLLAFLDAPSSGVIRFCFREVRYAEKLLLPLRRRVVLVDQNPILFTGSVWKNLEFGLKIRKVERKKRKKLIKEALELVGMQDFFAAEAHRLSGGETKRVALARALIIEPEVLLCDEPTANVDVENLEIILDILDRINRDRKISIIFATHSLSQAQRLAHHSLILKNGRLSTLPQENVFAAMSYHCQGGLLVCTLHNDVRITLAADGSVTGDGAVHLYLDPERIVLSREDMAGNAVANLLSGRVTMTAAENQRVRVRVDVGLPVNVLMTLSAYRKTLPLIGEDVFLYPDDEAISIV